MGPEHQTHCAARCGLPQFWSESAPIACLHEAPLLTQTLTRTDAGRILRRAGADPKAPRRLRDSADLWAGLKSTTEGVVEKNSGRSSFEVHQLSAMIKRKMCIAAVVAIPLARNNPPQTEVSTFPSLLAFGQTYARSVAPRCRLAPNRRSTSKNRPPQVALRAFVVSLMLCVCQWQRLSAH